MRIYVKRSVLTVSVVLAMGLLNVACSVFGIRSEEEPAYQVILTDGNREVRQYAGFIVATTLGDGDYDTASRIAFRRLFDYISGNNAKQQTITMTAPVLQENERTSMTMAAPVIQEATEQGWVMSFVMPKQFTMETLPVPGNPKVQLQQVAGKEIAVRSYTGWTSEQTISKLGEELQQWSRTQGFKAVSAPRSARYDPPWTIPFLRRSEIHLDVQRSDG